ncbi:MAG: hypothetical protein ABIL01_16505 [Pseudomonadota bacterium]
MHKIFASLLLILLCHGFNAYAFDNIEADAAYNGPIKAQIEEEFKQGLKMLRAQADSLKMDVREKDLKTLASHMYSKAQLMAQCVDAAITIKKTVTDKVLLSPYVKGCVETNLKFVSWLQTRKRDNSDFSNMFDNCSTMLTLKLQKKFEPAYSFLDIKPYLFGTDYVLLKTSCYDDAAALFQMRPIK